MDIVVHLEFGGGGQLHLLELFGHCTLIEKNVESPRTVPSHRVAQVITF